MSAIIAGDFSKMKSVLTAFIHSDYFMLMLIFLIINAILEMITCILTQKTWARLNKSVGRTSENSTIINRTTSDGSINLNYWYVALIIVAIALMPYAISHYDGKDVLDLLGKDKLKYPLDFLIMFFAVAFLPLIPKTLLSLANKKFQNFINKTGGSSLSLAIKRYRNPTSSEAFRSNNISSLILIPVALMMLFFFSYISNSLTYKQDPINQKTNIMSVMHQDDLSYEKSLHLLRNGLEYAKNNNYKEAVIYINKSADLINNKNTLPGFKIMFQLWNADAKLISHSSNSIKFPLSDGTSGESHLILNKKPYMVQTFYNSKSQYTIMLALYPENDKYSDMQFKMISSTISVYDK